MRFITVILFLFILLSFRTEKSWACGSLAASLGLGNSVNCPIQDLGPPDDIYYVPPSAGPSYNQPGWGGMRMWQMPSGPWPRMVGTPGLCWYTWHNVPVDHSIPVGPASTPDPNGYNAYNPKASNDYSTSEGASQGGTNCNSPQRHLYIWENQTGRETVSSW
jgi:hypothetical protein